MHYDDFFIQIGPDRGEGHPVNVLQSPAGEGSGLLQLPSDLDRWVAGLRLSGAQARGSGERHLTADTGEDTTDAWTARNVGDQLFRALFSGQIRSLYDHSLGTVGARPDHGLRIKLKLDAKDRELAYLASLPWEYLWRTDTQDFLSLSRLSPVVRYLDVPRPASPIQVGSKLRVLVVVSSPHGLEALNLHEEKRLLQEACHRWKGVEVTFLENAGVSSLRQTLLEKRFHALHFMGHGGFDETSGEGVLYFTNSDGSREPLSGEALSTLLKDSQSLGMVLLNACDTARLHTEGFNPFSGVANALVLGGIAAVIAMQFPISDEAAIAFSSTFYQQLAGGDPIDAAVVEGRRAVLSASPQTLEWGTPVLFLRVPEANVFQKRGRSKLYDEERGSAWSRGGVALSLGLLLAVGTTVGFSLKGWNTPASPTVRQELKQSPYSFEIDRAFASTQGGLAGVLTRVELTTKGRMRVYFHFRNGSRKDLGLGFDYRATYLADKTGNRYAVLAADAAAKDGETAVDQIQPGKDVERWIEFPAPRDQARTFHVGLAGSRGGAQFPLFSVELPEYPKELSVSIPPVKPDPNAAVLAVNHSISTNIQGFQGGLKGVELRDNQRMRWSFAFLNESDRDQTVSFDYAGIYLEDERGNRYSVLTSDTGGGPGQVYKESLQRAVRTDHWLEFPAPLNGARKFTVVLVSNDRRTLKFIPFTVQVPYYPPRYSRVVKAPVPTTEPTPKPVEPPGLMPPVEATPDPPKPPVQDPQRALEIKKADHQWATSVAGLDGSLQAIEVLEDGRVRWSFEFVNSSGKPQEFGLDLKESYVSDNLGHRYSIVRADNGMTGPVYQVVIPNGGHVAHWIEFPPPAHGAHKFIAVLTSHSPDRLRFLPFQAELPDHGAKPH